MTNLIPCKHHINNYCLTLCIDCVGYFNCKIYENFIKTNFSKEEIQPHNTGAISLEDVVRLRK